MTSIRITFKKPVKSGTEINVAATIKQLFSTMKSANLHLTILALDWQATFRPNNDVFPTNEAKFKQFFLVHPYSKNLAYKNHIMIGCLLQSSQTLVNLKETELTSGNLLAWLTQHKIFIEANTLGYEVTKVIGFLLWVHPHVVHCDALQEKLTLKLQALSINPKKVIALYSAATEHYQLAMDSGDHVDTYVPPFELFSTVISNTFETKHVNTHAIGVKCNTPITLCLENCSHSCSPTLHWKLPTSSFCLVESWPL